LLEEPDSIDKRATDASRSLRKLRGVLLAVSVVFAAVHTWAGRYSMSPDGISYLDVGSAFFRHDWFGAFNAYWSPLYAWVQGVALGLPNPSPRWEFPAAHVVNFVVFLIALVSFRFLLSSCLIFRNSISLADQRRFLPDWAVELIAHPVFWWVSFELIPIYEVGPDLALSACVYAAIGFLLRSRVRSRHSDFLLFGFLLGIGYWVKAPFFLLAFVLLVLAYFWGRGLAGWSSGIALASAAFLLTTLPLVLALSSQKHRATFGDSGRLNYAWFIAPQTFHRNWQGRELGSGTPVHPTREALGEPPVYVFEGPVVGSYPPWLDPSYWNEGLTPHFALKPQLRELSTDLMTEASLLLRAQPALLAGVILLLALSGGAVLAPLREFWPLAAFAVAAFGMYAPVHVEPRFLGGFVLLIFLLPMVVARLDSNDLRAGRYLAVVLFAVLTIGAVDTAYRYSTLRLLIPGNGPSPALDHVFVAERIRELGLKPGDSVAVIGDGTGAYWARLAKVRIIAEVMAADHDAQRFWRSSDATKEQVFAVFAGTGAKAVLAENPPSLEGTPWIRIGHTSWYFLPLSADVQGGPTSASRP
jgi:hypothetical protein